MNGRWQRIRTTVAVLLLLVCSAGAEEPKPAPEAPAFPPSGFLRDYSQLEPAGKRKARLVYLDTAVDFSGYTQVLIDRVAVWKSDEARFTGTAQAKREQLARELEAALRQAFASEFQMVEGKPTSGVLRLRTALTAAVAAPEEPGALQYLEVELELLDAVTQKRLAAAVDSKGRIGSRPAGPEAVEASVAFQDWAERATIRVAALRSLDRNYGQPETP